MYIKRDITSHLIQSTAHIQILLGPRQCGKSTLFSSLNTSCHEITFDDMQLRELANHDPALFLQQFEPPLLLDEVQYVPNLFPELKRKVDQLKKAALFGNTPDKPVVLYRLTGSNQILMDKNVKESLAGRAAYYFLNTLSVHEILAALPNTTIKDILFKGGWPELYINPTLSIIAYLNDYIRSYVEKDIVFSAGIHKLAEFHTVLRLLGARTAQETHATEISNNSGVSSVTVKEWIGLLERADLIYLLKPYFNNLNNRLIKSPKLYFLDTGLATRLQGWSDATPLMNSPQIGGLFETLVIAEVVKFIRNYGKDWELFFWRTKQGEEVDLIIKTAPHTLHAFEIKLAIHGIKKAIAYPAAFKKQFAPKGPLTIISYGGQSLKLSDECNILPLAELHDYLLQL
ncbi:ATP-binding protein [soil metagenome]